MKILNLIIIGVVMTGCESPYSTYDVYVNKQLATVDYSDGISFKEAKAIADAYLVIHGAYEDRPSYARMSDGDDVWLGRVYVMKSMATPVDADLPPVMVNKKDGTISWEYGPELAKIDVAELQAKQAAQKKARTFDTSVK